MKKLKGILLILICTILLTGCQNNTEKTMTCTSAANENGLQASFNYNVKYKGKYVTKIENIEKLTIDDVKQLEATKKEAEKIIETYNDIKYYDIDLTIEGNTIVSKATIDYEHIDTSKLMEIDSGIGSILENGKLPIENLKELYKSLGIECK